jgi:pimeloyl-ACP methyl ester carboxylesterase
LPPTVAVSNGGLEVAVHDLAPGVQAPPLLISHATGFCAHAYQPIADAVGDRLHSLGIDHRGHGATAAPAGWEAGRGVDWSPFGDDTLDVARAIAPSGGLVGFGHSMGGSALLLAAHRDPGAFDRLVLFEPIGGPLVDADIDLDSIPIVVGARRRRRRFDSFEQAYDNFRSKPPLSQMTPESLRGYVYHGLRPARGGGVELCCPPELEAAIFVTGFRNGVWDVLPEIDLPVTVIAGFVEAEGPAFRSTQIAERLPNCELLVLPHMDHFGPFSHPADVAELIVSRRS